MAPNLIEKCSAVDKCHTESMDSRQSRFPFHWLFRRSKSSRSAKEMVQSEKSTIPTSKSCDAAVPIFNSVEKYPTFLLWKLLPSKGKSNLQDKQNEINSGKSFKTSYSCSDVYGMSSASKVPYSLAHSSHNLTVQNDSQGLNNLKPTNSMYSVKKCNSTIDFTNVTSKCGELNSYQNVTHHLVLCKLCLAMIPAANMYSLEDCSCVFCVSCMQQYLHININEGNVTIMCPDANCASGGKVHLSEVQDLLGDDAYYKIQRFKLNRDVELDPCRTWCPTPGCETVCHFEPASDPNRGVSVHCLNCRLTFCSSCKLKWHGNKTCEEMRSMLSDEEDFYFSDEEDTVIKRCPNCRIPIERDEGCAQMMCKRCKHVFCWHCLASLDDDFLLRHYDKGPCRNKLGHSRASMIWHRTQVVGIFAGFSFLLLVASPILLLAAPCFLCCRCRNCKFVYEEATPL